MPGLPVRVVRLAEDLQRLVLGRGGESEIARVREELPRGHDAVDRVLGGLVVLLGARLGERHADRCRGLAALARMRLVNDDGEAPPPLLVPDLVEDERELLHRRDDDLLPARDKPAEVTRAVGMADGGPDLGELLDRVADLLVEDASIGDHDDGVEHPRVVLPEPDQLVGEPGDGVGLPAAGRMLDEIPLPCAVPARVGQEPSHHIELLVARPDLHLLLLARLLILGLDDLRVVFQDVGQPVAGEQARPEVVGLEAVRVGRVHLFSARQVEAIFRQVDESRRVGRAWGQLLLYYTLGSDPALWPAGERREGEYIMHDKGYYHS